MEQDIQQLFPPTPVHSRKRQREEFHRRLRKLIQIKNLSQAQLARMVFGQDEHGQANGADRVSRYLSGQSVPTLRTAHAMALALEIPPDCLLPPIRALRRDDVPDGHRLVSIEKVVPDRIADQIESLLDAADAGVFG